jgi:hypothetical protein
VISGNNISPRLNKSGAHLTLVKTSRADKLTDEYCDKEKKNKWILELMIKKSNAVLTVCILLH